MKHRWRLARPAMGGPPVERCTRCGVFRHERSALKPGWVEAWVSGVRILRDDCKASDKKEKP